MSSGDAVAYFNLPSLIMGVSLPRFFFVLLPALIPGTASAFATCYFAGDPGERLLAL